MDDPDRQSTRPVLDAETRALIARTIDDVMAEAIRRHRQRQASARRPSGPAGDRLG